LVESFWAWLASAGVTCDSVSPVAIFARASKTANRIAARRLRVAVVFVATAFVYIMTTSFFHFVSSKTNALLSLNVTSKLARSKAGMKGRHYV